MTEHKTPILIVNDNPHALLAMEAVVRNPGVQVIRAESGEDALRVLLRQDVAVILLDVKMPGMDGFQTAELIRERQRGAATPIIFVTAAQVGEHDLFKGYNLGAVDYLAAPFAAHILRSKVGVFVELFKQRLELEERTRLFKETQRIARLGSWQWLVKENVAIWSPELYAIFGRDPALDPPDYHAFLDQLDPDSVRRAQAATRAALQTGAPFELDLAARLPQGAARWVTVRGEAIRDAGGCVIKLRGTMQDISERKHVELALRDSEQRFQQTFTHASIGMAVVALDGRIIRANPALCGLLGYGEAELSAMTVRQITHADDVAVDEHWLTQLCGGVVDTYQLEKRKVRKDGEIIWVQMNRVSVKDAAGAPQYMITQIQDITTRRALEQERELQAKHSQELSRRLVAVQENERRRLSGELHDCTSPNLAAIQINLRMLADESAKNSTEQCGHCVDKLEDTEALVQDTVAGLRRICADLRPPVLDHAGFWPALEDYARQFSLRTGIAVQIERSGPEQPLGSHVDSLLFRIAQEALTNCAKHARADTVCIRFAVGKDLLILTIADNGIGFNPEGLGSSTPGHGLLTMRERAEFSGGSVSILSQPGEGTKIEVLLCP